MLTVVGSQLSGCRVIEGGRDWHLAINLGENKRWAGKRGKEHCCCIW